MKKMNDIGIRIKSELCKMGKSNSDLIHEIRKKYPSFDSKVLYDIMYTDRNTKYLKIVLEELGIRSVE